MPKPRKHVKRPRDVNQWARQKVEESTQQSPRLSNSSINATAVIPIPVTPASPAQISLLMSELGRKGGKIGGKRRLFTMTDEQRKRIAIKAAKVRWARHKGKQH
jgi:hypothetical protein